MSITNTIGNVRSYIDKCEPYRPEWGLRPCTQIEQHSISLWYTVYRWIQCVVHHLVFWGAILGVYTGTAQIDVRWPLYLTNWVVIGNTVQSLMGAIAVTRAYRHYVSGRSDAPNQSYGVSKMAIKIYTTVYSVALNFSIFVIFGYWELMGGLTAVSRENRIMFVCYGVSAFFMLVDLFVVKFPYKMKTGLYSLSIMVVYITITWLHSCTGSVNKPIYPGLNWSKPVAAVDHSLSSVFILEVTNCFVLWWLFQLRRSLRRTYHVRQRGRRSRQFTPAPEPPPPAPTKDPPQPT